MIKTNNPEIDIEKLIRRIRAEMARRKMASDNAETQATCEKPRFAAVVGNASIAESQAFSPDQLKFSPFAVQPVFQPKEDGLYHVNELLGYHDQVFLDVAYRAILRRSPDKDGCRHYLKMLRNGCAKIDILGRLRYSEEGRSVGAKIAGLALPFLLQQVYRIPVFGRFVQILSAIWHLPHLERNQRTFENHTILLMDHAQNHICESLARAIVEKRSEQAVINEAHAAVNEAHAAILSRIQKSLDDLQDSKVDLHSMEIVNGYIQDLRNSKVNQSTLDEVLLPIKTQTHDIKRNLLDQDRRLGLLLEEVRKRMPDSISTGQIEVMLAEDDHRMDSMYASFEDCFRGTREDIKQRQSIYLPVVLEAKAGTSDAPVLDLGCGRGEWLEFLNHEGLIARGVDINRIFLEGCRELSLDVVEQDAVSYLRTMKPNTIGAVTSFHLIEHLPLKTLIALLDETLRVLRPAGVVILETPNPANVRVGSCNFYYDPTHRNPLPGPLTQYLLEARGFSRTRFMPLHPYPVESPDRITEGSPQVQRIFNEYFLGPQDYAVVGWKS